IRSGLINSIVPPRPHTGRSTLTSIGGDIPSHFEWQQQIRAAVGMPYCTLHQAIVQPCIQQTRIDLLGSGIDANITPVRGNQFGSLWGQRTDAQTSLFDEVCERLAIATQAYALGILLIQAHLIK